MPETGPGQRRSVIATKALTHGDPCVVNGFPGFAAKSTNPAGMYPSPANAILATQIAIGEEFVQILVGIHPVPLDDLPAGVEEGDPLWIAEADDAIHDQGDDDAVAARLNTGVIASNNSITWTARDAGEDGDNISVTFVDPGGTTAALTVDTDGDSIIVSLARAASAISSTAADVRAAVLEHDVASQLVTTANNGASNGTGLMTALALTHLAGGADEGEGLVKFGRLSDIDEVREVGFVNLNMRNF